MATTRKSASRARSRASGGCLFWAVLAVVLLSVGIAARKPLEEAFRKLTGKPAASAPTVVVKPPGAESPQGEPGAQREPAPPANPPERIVPVPEEKPPIRKTRLFFASVGQNGKVELKGVIRPIPATDSPLRDTLLTLLSGPTSQEVNQGLLTMIPSGARLRSVAVRGDTAYIDFNEGFRFSTLGREGLNAQLEQIVYAATEFPTVKRVQLLIEGARVQYLGPEGIRIDAPLTRASFQD